MGWRAVAHLRRHVQHAAAAREAEQIDRGRETHHRRRRLHRDDRGQLGSVPGRPKAASSATLGGYQGAAVAPLLHPGGEDAPLGPRGPPCACGRGPGAGGRPHGLLRARAVRPLLRARAVWTCWRACPRAQARGGRRAAPSHTRGAARPCCWSADRARRRTQRTAGCRSVGVGLGVKGSGGGWVVRVGGVVWGSSSRAGAPGGLGWG